MSEIAIDKLGLPEWEGMCEANQDVVNGNCDLIFPGQKLYFADNLLMPKGAPVPVEPQAAVEPVPAPVDPAPEVVEGPVGQEEVVDDVEPELQTSGQAFVNNSFGPVSATAQRAADRIFGSVPGASLIDIGGTRASARDPQGHPSGNALDYMVLDDAALGDAIAQYHIDNWNALGVDYIIWQQRIRYLPTGPWVIMEDRGSVTQNHYDHVHVNYRP